MLRTFHKVRGISRVRCNAGLKFSALIDFARPYQLEYGRRRNTEIYQAVIDELFGEPQLNLQSGDFSTFEHGFAEGQCGQHCAWKSRVSGSTNSTRLRRL